jgi:hypothetical protein
VTHLPVLCQTFHSVLSVCVGICMHATKQHGDGKVAESA